VEVVAGGLPDWASAWVLEASSPSSQSSSPSAVLELVSAGEVSEPLPVLA
jgi:hypothetical protein